MMKKNKIITVLITVLSLLPLTTACKKSEFTEITGWETVGLIRNFDKNNDNDLMEQCVLIANLPNLEGEIALADVEVLGTKDGITYTLNTYASYKKDGDAVIRVSSDSEFAKFTSPSVSDYEEVGVTTEILIKPDTFLPTEIVKQSDSSTEPFDFYVYTMGESEKSLQQEAEAYYAEQQ